MQIVSSWAREPKIYQIIVVHRFRFVFNTVVNYWAIKKLLIP